MTYQDAVAYLESFINFERSHQPGEMRALPLERMRELCRRLGDPQRRFRSVLVTGTNAKGSICAMLYSMLRESTLRTGLYTSPHLEHLRERIRVWDPASGSAERRHADDWISESELSDLVGELAPALDAMRQAGQAPSCFEVMTALAFLHFSRRQVEIAVLEVGLGGRLDATNVVEQAVSVIGPVGLDHADILGPDPVAIAREKAGIIKPGQVVLSAPQQGEVLDVLRVACDSQGVPLVVCGEDLTVTVQDYSLDGLQITVAGLRGIYESLELPLIGRHQAQNAALAIGALEALSSTGVPHALVERGLARAEWPGRLEVVHDAPLVLLDGAHNPQAAMALRDTLVELCPGRKIHLLIGMSGDKAIEEVGHLLGRIAAGVTCTQSRNPRAVPPTELAMRLAPYCPDVHVMTDAIDAYTYLLNALAPQDLLVVTGSLFLVGELRAALRYAHVKRRRAAVAE